MNTINEYIETTKDQVKYDLKDTFEDLVRGSFPLEASVYRLPTVNEMRIQFSGLELVLNSDGTYCLFDTTGG